MTTNLLGVSTWAEALSSGVLSFALRATVLLLAAWAATTLMRRASAATRHLVWTGAIVGVLLLPVLDAALPEWNVRLLPARARVADVVEAPSAAPSAVARSAPYSATRSLAALEQVGAAAGVVAGAPPLSPSDERPTVRRTVVSAADTLFAAVNATTAFAALWLALAGLLVVRLAIANARVSAWQRASLPVEDPRALSLLRRLCRRYAIQRPVVLLESDDTDVPVTWGVVYPVILLPATAGWDEEQLVAVLTHELAHVKRFDALTQQLAQLAMALLWFHPLVWLAVRRMRLEREHACDDFVLIAGARASRYADDLLGLARRLTRPTAPAAAALAKARRSELEERLLAILDPAARRDSVRAARVMLVVLSVIGLSMPLAAFRPSARASGSPPERAARVAALVPRAERSAFPAGAPTVQKAASVTPLVRAEPDRPVLESIAGRLGIATPRITALPGMPELLRIRVDTDPARPVDLETLIEVTRATKRMTADAEKGQLLALIAKRYQRSDALRDAYLDAVSSMSSDDERTKALIALLDRDSLPLGAVAHVLRATAEMSSDMSKGMVLKRISPAAYADTAVQRAYLDAITAMSSDAERGAALAVLLKQPGLSPELQLALLDAIAPLTSSVEKANALMLFLDSHRIGNERVRRAFFTVAETLVSDTDYRRVMTAVMK